MAFTRNKTDAVGVDTPNAADFGMTAVDPLFPQPPEVTILGPLGTFRLFGTNPNDNHFQTVTYSLLDNLSWTRRQAASSRLGEPISTSTTVALTQAARAARSRSRPSPISSSALTPPPTSAPPGAATSRPCKPAKASAPLATWNTTTVANTSRPTCRTTSSCSPTLTLNFGVRWEFIGPSYDTSGTIGNAWPSLLRQAAIPPLSAPSSATRSPPTTTPPLVNPYTGKPFGPPPEGVLVRSTNCFYENGTPRDQFAPRAGFAWQPFGSASRIVVGGGYGWFYQTPAFSGNAGAAPLFTSPPFAQSFTNTDASNNLSTFEQPFPATTLGYVPRTPTSQLSDRVAGPEYRDSSLAAVEPQPQNALRPRRSLSTPAMSDLTAVAFCSRTVSINRCSPARPTPSIAATMATRKTASPPTRRAMQSSASPSWAKRPTALLASEFGAHSWYHSLQATLRSQISHGLSFQAAYTLSKALSNTAVYNDQNRLDLAKGRASFDRTHRLIANFDYQIPAPIHASGFRGGIWKGWSLSGIVIVQSGLPMTLTDPNAGAVYGRAGTSTVTMCPGSELCRACHVWQRLRPPRSLDRHRSHLRPGRDRLRRSHRLRLCRPKRHERSQSGQHRLFAR